MIVFNPACRRPSPRSFTFDSELTSEQLAT